MFQIDETAQQLQALVLAEALLGDHARSQVAKSMLELYLLGHIAVTFDEQGEPSAELIESEVPIVAFPLFTSPDLVQPKEPRTIGFKPN